MKILFVSSGNSINFEIAPFIYIQGESLKEQNVDIHYYTIKGKGIKGYLKNIKPLKNQIKKEAYDIIHAHYVLSGLIAILSGKKNPIVLSLMGDDAYGSFNSKGKLKISSIYLIILSKIIQFQVKHIIVKSENIKKTVLNKRKVTIIPNGVNLNIFKSKSKKICRKELGLTTSKRIVLFLGNPEDSRKNLKLAKQAIQLSQIKNLELVIPYPVQHCKVPKLLNAADILLFTSTAEGSPNIIKEAMACNCPTVSTDVGDVRWVFGNTKGYFISTFDPEDVAEKISLAFDFVETNNRTHDQHRINSLGLDSISIAKKIIEVYQQVLNIK